MAERPATEKTEQPTHKRLSKARTEGQIPQSQEVLSLFSIVVLVTAVALLASGLVGWCTDQIKQGLGPDVSVFSGSESFAEFVNSKVASMMALILPVCAALCVGAVAGNIIVGGLNYCPKAVKIDFGAINPLGGLGRLVNMRSMVRLLASVLKLLFVSAIAWWYLQDKLEELALLRWTWSVGMLSAMGKLILGLLTRICIALLVLAAADMVFQKWKYMQDLKMTKQEVKEELKRMEGDPVVKRRRREVQLCLMLQRIRSAVPKADVVVTNPTEVAVAIRYDARTMAAPRVVAKGRGFLAQQIRRIAIEHGVPIVERPPLAQALYKAVEVGQEIPPQFYRAVAEILAYVYELTGRAGRYRSAGAAG